MVSEGGSHERSDRTFEYVGLDIMDSAGGEIGCCGPSTDCWSRFSAHTCCACVQSKCAQPCGVVLRGAMQVPRRSYRYDVVPDGLVGIISGDF